MVLLGGVSLSKAYDSFAADGCTTCTLCMTLPYFLIPNEFILKNSLQDAVMLFSSYSLKDSEQVLHHVIQLFVETTRLEALPVEEMMLEFPG